jgi:hypothetical protein
MCQALGTLFPLPTLTTDPNVPFVALLSRRLCVQARETVDRGWLPRERGKRAALAERRTADKKRLQGYPGSGKRLSREEEEGLDAFLADHCGTRGHCKTSAALVYPWAVIYGSRITREAGGSRGGATQGGWRQEDAHGAAGWGGRVQAPRTVGPHSSSQPRPFSAQLESF